MINLYLKKFINPGIYLIVFLIPAYVFYFKIWLIPINLLEVLIGVLFFVWFIGNFNKIPEMSRDAFKSPLFLPIFLIFLGVTFSTLFSDVLRTSAGIWKGWFIIPLLFFVVVLSEIKNKKQVQKIILSLLFSGLGVSLIALFYFFSHNLTYDGRLRAFYESPNHLAMYLSPILILSLCLYFLVKNRLLKVLLVIYYLLLFLVIYLTYSYGAWAGLLVSLFFVLLIAMRSRLVFNFNKQKNAIYLLTLLFLLILSFFLSQINSQKFQGMLDLSYPSLSSRFVIWQSASEIIKDHPLNGIGPGLFQKYYLEYQVMFEPYLEWTTPQPHNIFLAFWLQTGLIGLVGFLWLLIRFFKTSFFCLMKNKDNCADKLLIIILMAAMIYILIHGLVDTTYWKNDLSIVFWLIIALNYKAIRFSC